MVEARLAWDRGAVGPARDIAVEGLLEGDLAAVDHLAGDNVVEVRPAEGVRKTAWRDSKAS